jgi:flagellar motor component MotA
LRSAHRANIKGASSSMFAIVGIIVLLVMVFGGFALTGGNLGPVMHALPHEMLIIGGACLGALIIGNSAKELKALGGGLGKVFKGPKYNKQDYLDCIFLVSRLMKMLKTEGPWRSNRISKILPVRRSSANIQNCSRTRR